MVAISIVPGSRQFEKSMVWISSAVQGHPVPHRCSLRCSLCACLAQSKHHSWKLSLSVVLRSGPTFQRGAKAQLRILKLNSDLQKYKERTPILLLTSIYKAVSDAMSYRKAYFLLLHMISPINYAFFIGD